MSDVVSLEIFERFVCGVFGILLRLNWLKSDQRLSPSV